MEERNYEEFSTRTWIRKLRTRIQKLKEAGADLNQLERLVLSNPGRPILASVQAEVDSLDLLRYVHDITDHQYEKPEDHTFPSDRISYSVKHFSLDRKASRVLNWITFLTWKLTREPKSFKKVFVGGRPTVLAKRKIAGDYVKSAEEILISTSRIQPQIGESIWDTIRDIQRSFNKKQYEGTRVGVIEMKSFPVELDFVVDYITMKFRTKNPDIGGVLFLLNEQRFGRFVDRFLPVSNPYANKSLNPQTYEKVAAKYPLISHNVFSNPVRLSPKSRKPFNVWSRGSDGSVLINGENMGSSFTSESIVSIVGLLGETDNINWLQFTSENERKRVYLP